jgi:hypothetical protein
MSTKDPVIDATNKGAHSEVTPEEAVEIIEEECTETGLKSDEEFSTYDDVNQNSECSYFLKDRRVFTEELQTKAKDCRARAAYNHFRV